MSDTIIEKLVTDALILVIRRRGMPDILLHYSDHSSQHLGYQCQRLKAEFGGVCGVTWSVIVEDNGNMDSFFLLLKTLCIVKNL